MSETLLVIEDERLLGSELVRHYEREGWDAVLAPHLARARELLLDEQLDPLVVLSDMSLPDGNALDLLEEVRGRGAGGEWVLLTGYGGVRDSVRALRLGAYDFLEKPCEQDRLDVVVSGAARSARAQRRLAEHTSSQSVRYTVASFVGRSAAAERVRRMLGKLAEVPFSALVITGETGTGKGLAARILHHGGPRRNEPLVEVNCAALPKELLESELFGHEAGAFTGAKGRRRGLFEQADGGTLFLDEISEMDVDLQSKLLTAIEDRTVRRLGGSKPIAVDVQVVAASNRNLERRIGEGSFRDDLYHRLGAFRLELPPLRDRREDLEDLVPAMVAEFNALAGKQVRVVPDAVWERLRAHRWPGNIRELRNVVERCVLFADGDRFPVEWLQLDAAPPAARGPGELEDPAVAPGAPGHDAPAQAGRLELPLDGSVALADMDRLIIRTALERNEFNVTATARLLGTTRETLRYRIQKYGLKRTPR